MHKSGAKINTFEVNVKKNCKASSAKSVYVNIAHSDLIFCTSCIDPNVYVSNEHIFKAFVVKSPQTLAYSPILSDGERTLFVEINTLHGENFFYF
jgi:hypothetical protein